MNPLLVAVADRVTSHGTVSIPKEARLLQNLYWLHNSLTTL